MHRVPQLPIDIRASAPDTRTSAPASRVSASTSSVQSRRSRQAGQGMTEYIIIVALIAVAAIGVYTLFGQTLRNQTAGLAMELSGQDAATSISNARTNATRAQTDGNQRKGLENYNATNH